MKKAFISQKSLLLSTPIILSLYAFLLFAFIGGIDSGLVFWKPARNITVVLYLSHLFISIFLRKSKNNLYFLSNKNLKTWFIGLFFSVFSYAIGGLIFDLIVLFNNIRAIFLK